MLKQTGEKKEACSEIKNKKYVEIEFILRSKAFSSWVLRANF